MRKLQAQEQQRTKVLQSFTPAPPLQHGNVGACPRRFRSLAVRVYSIDLRPWQSFLPKAQGPTLRVGKDHGALRAIAKSQESSF